MFLPQITILIIVSILSPSFSRGEDVKQKEPTGSGGGSAVNLYLENDTSNLGGPGTDRAYTNGIRLSYVYAENKKPKWGRWLTEHSAFLSHLIEKSAFDFGIGVGQQIFTPEDLTQTQLIRNDRPYAGWLYAGAVMNVRTERFLDSFELDLGVVGPESQAEDVQRDVHRIMGIKQPLGWKNQLKTEAGGLLSYQRRMKLYEVYFGKSKSFELIPYAGAAIGNILTGANLGAVLRLGYNLPADFGPTRPSGSDGDPFLESPTTRTQPLSWSVYGFLGSRENLVLRNIFLDGNTFQDSQRVTKRTFVTEFEGGFAGAVGPVAVTWREVVRSPEFFESEHFTGFGSITLTFQHPY